LTLFHRYMRPMVEAGRGFRPRPAPPPVRATRPGPGAAKEIYNQPQPRAAPQHAGTRAQRPALERAAAALQGARRDGRRPAGRYHDGPEAPDAAPDQD